MFPIGPPDGFIEKRHKNDEDPSLSIKDPSKLPFFAHQITGDLCGTMAMIHNIANNQDVMPVIKGSWMDKFLKENANKTPHERGIFIDNSYDLFELHNKNARDSDAPLLDGKVDTHFACFTEVGGILWELDGRKPFPINHGKCSDNILLQTYEIIKEDFFKYLSPDDQLRSSIITMSKI